MLTYRKSDQLEIIGYFDSDFFGCQDSSDVSFDTWWLDSGATILSFNSMQTVIIKRSPTSLEQYGYMRDDTRVKVDFLGVVRL